MFTGKSFTLIVATVLLIAVGGCVADRQDGAQSQEHGQVSGIYPDLISETVAPGDNFYLYVNEGWIENATLPAGFSFYNEPWSKKIAINKQLEAIISGTDGSDDETSPAIRQVRHFYQSYLDRAAANERGLQPIRSDLSRIEQLGTHEDAAEFMGEVGAASLFHLLVQAPVDMTGGYILTVAQYRTTGLGLPSQAHYLSGDNVYVENRAAYRSYIISVFENAGVADSALQADQVIELETAYADIMWDFAQLRDAGASFNLVPADDLKKLAPGFSWERYLNARGVSDLEEINMGVGAISESAALFETFSMNHWKAYFTFHWINSHARLLPDNFAQAHFEFFEKTLFGIEERDSLEAEAVNFTERYIGDQLGRIYVDKFFPKEKEEAVKSMLPYIRAAFREKLYAAEWMDSDTRIEALQKLDLIIVEAGYPQIGPDWSSLSVSSRNPVTNRHAALSLQWNYNRSRIGQPISRYGDWNMDAHDIGMGYHQQYNKIFITAGALEVPFFNMEADMAVNFGSVGQTLAHEFGHALDDQGSAFDSRGALRDWWEQPTRVEYTKRTTGLINQFSEYEVLPGTPLRSAQMIGEIVGDLVGTSVAYRAYELYLDEHPQEQDLVLDGFTGSQRFFIGAAQQTRSIATDDNLRYQALNASHPPAEFRINGIFRNFGPWYEAFDVTPESDLYLPPSKRIMLW